MIYEVEIKTLAEKDIRSLQNKEAIKILERILKLESGLKGDIKKLTNFTPEYRLRIGNYRVLFEIVKSKIIVYRVIHRKDSYK